MLYHLIRIHSIIDDINLTAHTHTHHTGKLENRAQVKMKRNITVVNFHSTVLDLGWDLENHF